MNSLRTAACVLALAVSPVAAAQSYPLVVNGQAFPTKAVTVNGQTFVPLSALTLLGVPSRVQGGTLTLGTAVPGGADQRASMEGCVGDTLFNGVWRLTVRSVTPVERYGGQQKGYAVTFEWKNGSAATTDGQNTGVKGLQLILQDGRTLESEAVQDVLYRKLAQGAGNTFTLAFYADTAASAHVTPADKLLVEIDPAVLRSTGVKAAYSTPTPSFRVRLGCRK